MTCDCEAPSVFDETERTARKEHVCADCRDAILPGVRYRDIKGLWDGSWSAFAICLPCAALRSLAVSVSDSCDCIAFGALFETIREDERVVRRIAALPCASDEDAARVGTAFGHLYGVLHAEADRETEEYRAWLATKKSVVAA